MFFYHQNTVDLLGIVDYSNKSNTLEEYAEKNGIKVPKSFLEWSKIDSNKILEKYSNDDHFWLSDPETVSLSDGRKGLLFCRENQGNFDKIVLLDSGDDPPVLMSWIGKEPWITYSQTFSDCIYAQIFDWQYWLEFDDDGYADITYYGEMELRSDTCLEYFRKEFSEKVKSSLIIDEAEYTEFRFLKSAEERITVTVSKNRYANVRITGKYDLVRKLENEILLRFANQIIPPTFNTFGGLAGYLEHNINKNELIKIAHSCSVIPNKEALQKLVFLNKAQPLNERFPNGGFPITEQLKTQGELKFEWEGLLINLREASTYWWKIESIAEFKF